MNFYFKLLKLSYIFYKYKKSLHQLESLLIIKIFSSIIFIDKYFYLELRLCPWLTGYFTLPNIKLQSSSKLTLQVMYSVHEMMKHCLSKTLIFWGFLLYYFLSFMPRIPCFLLWKFLFSILRVHIMNPNIFPVFPDPPLPLWPSLSRRRKEKRKNLYIRMEEKTQYLRVLALV